MGLSLGLIGLLGGAACELSDPDLPVPSAAEARAHYKSAAGLNVRVSGNVVEIKVNQPLRQVQRGGPLWAKVGPYIYLFTGETEALFAAYPGLAGVHVITQTSRRNTEVARALLRRDELNEITWKRALNISGQARVNGTQRPAFLEDLVEWGEDHTEFEYSRAYVKR